VVAQGELLYRQVLTLADGTRLLLRPLRSEDREALGALYATVGEADRRLMRDDVRDPQVVAAWVESLDYSRVFPLVAVIGERIVGNATLHFGTGPARHRAEVRIFLAKDFRRRGLGSRMLQALIEVARQKALCFLEAQIIEDQTRSIHAFHGLGFETRSVLPDFFAPDEGEMLCLVHLVKRLRSPGEEF
jgi:acetyltransferase